MNRKTLFTVGALFAVIAMVLFLENAPEETAVERWTLPGFLENPNGAVKNATELLPPPIDQIQIERPEGAFTLKRKEGVWELISPRKATVEQVRVQAMLLPFQTPTASLFSQTVKEEELKLYGLEKAPIRVALFEGESLFTTFVIGDIARSDDPEAAPEEVDTWIQKPDTNQVFRMPGKDFRKPFDHTASSIRSKKVFLFDRENIRAMALHNPESAAVPVLKLVDEAAEVEAGTERKSQWRIVEPSGFEIGSITSTINSFANLRATEFGPKDITDEVAGLRPEDSPFKAEITLLDGSKTTLLLGKTIDSTSYGRVVGANEIFAMEDYTARGIRKGLDDVRNRKVLNVTAGGVTNVRFNKPGIELTRTEAGWKMPSHPTIPVSQSAVEAMLKDLEAWTVTGFAPASEQVGKGLDAEANPERVSIAHNGTKTTILIGELLDNIHWAMRDGADLEIWKATPFMAEKLIGKTSDDFRERGIFNFKRDDIARVELVHSNQTLIIEHNPDGQNEETWSVTRGEDKVNKPKPQLVSSILSSIANVQVKAFADDVNRKGAGLEKEGVFHARIKLKDGSLHRLEISDDSRDKSPYAAAPSVGIWKNRVFTMNRFQAESIRKKYKDFIN